MKYMKKEIAVSLITESSLDINRRQKKTMKDNMILKILTYTRELIKEEKNWTQGVFARDIDGNRSSVYDGSDCHCYCLAGAIIKTIKELGLSHVDYHHKIYYYLSMDNGNYMAYNDDPNTSHKDIIDLLDKKISYLE